MGLSTEGLTEVPWHKGMLCRKAALEAFVALRESAAAAGFELDIASAWRSFERQYLIFDEKFHGRRQVLDAQEQPFDLSLFTPAQKVAAIVRFSAIPGFSRHHFGSEFDIFAPNLLPPGQTLQLTAWEYSEQGYFHELGLWLDRHLKDFGFFRPYQGSGSVAAEPWHISHGESAAPCESAFNLPTALALLKNRGASWYAEVKALLAHHLELLPVNHGEHYVRANS